MCNTSVLGIRKTILANTLYILGNGENIISQNRNHIPRLAGTEIVLVETLVELIHLVVKPTSKTRRSSLGGRAIAGKMALFATVVATLRRHGYEKSINGKYIKTSQTF